jgi:hypothetical protein
MKKHIYEYDEIVVGNNLAALFYCYKNLCPLLFKETFVYIVSIWLSTFF